MGSTINLYYTYSGENTSKWELIPSRLLVIDDIAAYLNTKTKLTLNDFQYIKNDLEIGINVDLPQSYSQPNSSTNFKYVSIQNSGEKIHYYYVKKATWRSKSCVRFELIMDVLNTFKEGEDYKFHSNTRIVREHKDRFFVQPNSITLAGSIFYEIGEMAVGNNVKLFWEASGFTGDILEGTLSDFEIIPEDDYASATITFNADNYDIDTINNLLALDRHFYIEDLEASGNDIALINITHTYTGNYYRNIDYVSENITPTLINTGRSIIEKTPSIVNKNWYLLYRNQDNPTDSLVNPVECYLIPESATNVDSGEITSGKITAASLVYGKYYYARIYEENLGGTALIRQSITLPDGSTYDGADTSRFRYGTYVEISRNRAETINVIIYNYYSNYQVIATFLDVDFVQLNNLPFKYVRRDTRMTTGFYLNSMWNNESSWTNTTTPAQVYSIQQLDRTDAKNIKLIKLPYCPYDFTISGGKLVVSSNDKWNYTSFTQANNTDFYALKLANLNTNLSSTLTQNTFPFDNLRVFFPASASINDLKDRYVNQETESKLLHSDFYRPTFVYDSFSFAFQMEKLNMNYYKHYTSLNTSIKFDMTKTINSKFMFTFTNYICNKAEQNYYNVMPIARNNEEVLYNVPYINYIRTGYNYDVKAKNVSNASNVIGLGLSMASVGASLLAPSVPLKIAGVVATLVSTAMSVKNTIVSAINNENSIKQKLLSTQNQASSVAGSDDVDLMSVYAENRLSYIVYEPTEFMKKILKDLFFYAGYNSGRLGIPNHNTRLNFDYLECEASIEAISSIPEECLNELVNCMKTGITYLHKTNRSGANKWDFEQKYENWEKWLFAE